MSDTMNAFAKPAFAGKARPAPYYEAVSRIIATLRDTASLATIAAHMNSVGVHSPRGKPWSKATVANFLRKKSL